MEAPFDTEFLIRRMGQLWTEAARLPEKSAAQTRIEELACNLSDYVSSLEGENAEFPNSDAFARTRARGKRVRV